MSLMLHAPLTEVQCDGRACVVCESDHRPMVPVPGVETTLSTHLFHCDRTECAALGSRAEVRARIPRAYRLPRGSSCHA
jgi:hypothetical protein